MRPPRRSSAWRRAGRWGLAICIGLLAAAGTCILVEALGRVSVASAFLLRPALQRGACAVVGAAGAGLAARRLPDQVWLGWLPVTLASVAVLGLLWFPAYLGLHLRWGTPTFHCERAGLDVDECIGRDWSFVQARRAFRRMSGPIDSVVCQRFVSRVPTAPASAIDDDGWVRCPYDDPSVWTRRDCGEIGLTGREQCFTCSGMSLTNDIYTHVQAFDEGCTEATITYGVNVPPSAIDACQRSVYESVCRGGE